MIQMVIVVKVSNKTCILKEFGGRALFRWKIKCALFVRLPEARVECMIGIRFRCQVVVLFSFGALCRRLISRRLSQRIRSLSYFV